MQPKAVTDLIGYLVYCVISALWLWEGTPIIPKNYLSTPWE